MNCRIGPRHSRPPVYIRIANILLR